MCTNYWKNISRKGIFSRNCTEVNPDGALLLFIGGGDRLGGEGVLNTRSMAYSSLLSPHFFRHPLTAKAVPSPYKQGESAVRTFLHSARVTTYYLLLTTSYFNSYFLSFFSPFAEKTLTNFNIHTACFVNYKGPASADNTHNFYKNTNNFSFSPNNFSDSPSNFTDF